MNRYYIYYILYSMFKYYMSSILYLTCFSKTKKTNAISFKIYPMCYLSKKYKPYMHQIHVYCKFHIKK